MVLAERISDAEMAQTALSQSELAFAMTRDGHTSSAAYFAAQLPKADALVPPRAVRKTAKIKQRWLRGKRVWIHLALGEFR